MPTSQMNVRIDDATRIEGNAVFESIGWSPSQAALETSKADFLVTGDEVLRRKAPVGAFDSAGMLEHLRLREEVGL